MSTEPAAELTVHDPSATATGRLVNGPGPCHSRYSCVRQRAFAPLGSPEPAAPDRFATPVGKRPVTIDVKQPIAETDSLRAGEYAKTWSSPSGDNAVTPGNDLVVRTSIVARQGVDGRPLLRVRVRAARAGTRLRRLPGARRGPLPRALRRPGARSPGRARFPEGAARSSRGRSGPRRCRGGRRRRCLGRDRGPRLRRRRL